jgi:hypothetical protein
MIHITEAHLPLDLTGEGTTVGTPTTVPDLTTGEVRTLIGVNASGWRRSAVVSSVSESVLSVSVTDRNPIVRHPQRRDLRPNMTDVQRDSLQVRISAPKRSESVVVRISACRVAWVV